MEALIEGLTQLFLNDRTRGDLVYLFAGCLFTLFFLERRANFFENFHKFNNNFKLLVDILQRYEARDKLKKDIQAYKDGDYDSENF